MEKTDTQIGIRVSKEFKLLIEAQAQQEHRTVSNFVVKVLADYLAQVSEHSFVLTE